MSNISPNPLGFRLEHDNDPGAQALCSYKRSCEIAKPNSHADVIEATWRKLRKGWFLLFVWTWTTWCPALFGMFFQRNDKFCRYMWRWTIDFYMYHLQNCHLYRWWITYTTIFCPSLLASVVQRDRWSKFIIGPQSPPGSKSFILNSFLFVYQRVTISGIRLPRQEFLWTCSIPKSFG